MNKMLKIFCIVLGNIFFVNANVSAFNSKHLGVPTVNNTKLELQQIIAPANPIGTKVVSNHNEKKREADAIKPQAANKIREVREEFDGRLNIVAEIVDDKAEIKILIFNMLGKEVRKIFQGVPTEKNDDGYYVFTSEKPLNLPKNAYILVIQGNTFRIADRFIIAR